MSSLTTEFSKNMDKSTPFGDYPRPRLVRDSYICLNGEWDFAYSREEPREYTEKILVPFPPESALSGIERGHEDGIKLYYRRTFTLPDGFVKKSVILHFGAVDQLASVYINGVPVGENEGGYIPFSFDITSALVRGENEIKVVATDDLDTDLPYGKQTKKRGGMWYTPVSGIWQTVWLESLPNSPIKSVKITQSAKEAAFEVECDSSELKLTLLDSGEVYSFNSCRFTVKPREIRLWSPEEPNLYRYKLESEHDEVTGYFALREIGTATVNGAKRLTLNGKPYLFNGLLDQGYFPDGLFLPATPEGYKNDILTAKALGFNTLRKHIKIEPEIFYYMCDLYGIAVFQDMVNNSDYSFFRDTALPTLGMKRIPDKWLHKRKRSRTVFIKTMNETIEHLYSYPCVLYYTIFNEGWGQFCSDEIYETAKALDKTRIFDSTSGWFKRKKSDVISHHVYFKKLRAKPDAERPVVISEFGGYSYRCDGHVFGDGNYGYRSMKTAREFEESLFKLYEEEVKPLVEKCVSALIYTQISDIEDETNGFLTYDRRVLKIDSEKFKKLVKSIEETIK